VTVNKKKSIQADAQEISSQRSKICFSDIIPRDLETEEHAREEEVREKLAATPDIKDMLTNVTGTTPSRPSVDDVHIASKF
jgi:hypothetical protein